MPNTKYIKPFDNRLLVGINYMDATSNDLVAAQLPFSDKTTVSTNGLLMSRDELIEKKETLVGGNNPVMSESEFEKLLSIQESKLAEAAKEKSLLVQNALMNPYAKIRLAGAIDSDGNNRLIDSSSRRPWYETDNVIDDSDVGYSKYPTTARLIEWGKNDERGRTPYQFQDFVFSKWWNKIPNNRLITLRRFAQPILDNLSIPADDASNNQKIKFPPIATAITYFGEDTGNSLNEILKFSTGLNWGDVSANVWEVTSTNDTPSTTDVLGGGGSKLGLEKLFTLSGHALNGLSILNNDVNLTGLAEANGLPPDPYVNGPYENRIKGPVNRIDSVKKREAGLKFEMSGLKLKFDYVARPIGGINSKAVLLDILSNFMLMGSASAIFFGGAHRFRIAGTRFPATSQQPIMDLYNGQLEVGIKGMFNKFTSAVESTYDGDSFLGMISETAKGLLSDLLNAIGNPFGAKVNDTTNDSAQTAKAGIKNAIIQKMHTGMKYPYLQGMRALLIGEPVGEWHVTIGNPMNPIAMIGNLICTNIEVEFNEEAGLGPDDFH